MNTRWRVRLLPLAATPLLLTGCTVPAQFRSRSDPDAVTLWYWNRSIEPELFRQYERDHPGVRIDDQIIGGDYSAKLRTVLAGQTAIPDIVAFNDNIATYFRAEEQFADLYEYGLGEVENQYLGWKWGAGVTPSGKLMGFPMDTGPIALFYRADLFEQAGLPSDPDEVSARMSTWEDFYAAGQQLQSAIPGTFLLDSANEVYISSLRQSADYYVTRDDLYIGDGESVRRSWNLGVQAAQLGVVARTNTFTSDWSAAATTGALATFVNAVWMKAVLADSAADTAGRWRVAQAPGGAGNRGGSFLGVTQASQKKELAADIIRSIQSPAGQVVGYTSLDLYPAAPAALTDPALQQPEKFYGGQNTNEVFAIAAENVPDFYYSGADDVLHPIFTDEMTNVAILGKDPEQAWADAQSQVRREVRHKMPWVRFEEA
ncbi:MAG TPA: extracellular solute-binding protein [Thermomicrobiales bacterium]|jgi:cellobiose transport system substrate-binding protein|nr:extracellular solute-binding protein [Thermomicrobiales bacterium]